MPFKPLNLLGMRFNHLLVVSVNPCKDNRQMHWNCLCDCGNTIVLKSTKLTHRKQYSCGCMTSKLISERSTTHGHRKNGVRPDEYRIWSNMKYRCSSVYEKNYYGRGIIVCDRWVNSYDNFLSDMGPRPSKKHSIDRIDVNGNYEPSNCRWATSYEQFRNKTNNRWIEFHGWSMILKDWADILGSTPPKLCTDLKTKSFSEIFTKHTQLQ